METTMRLIVELDKLGADIIELGVPFSDPVADGPTIAQSYERALKNNVTLLDCIALVKKLRTKIQFIIGLTKIKFLFFVPQLLTGV